MLTERNFDAEQYGTIDDLERKACPVDWRAATGASQGMRHRITIFGLAQRFTMAIELKTHQLHGGTC